MRPTGPGELGQLSLAIRGSAMNGKRATNFHPDQVVDDVFRVCSVAQQSRATGSPYFVLTLASNRGRYEAITGWPAAGLAPGDAVRVRGCVLRRGSKLVLVTCLLWLVDWQTHCIGSNGNEDDMSAAVVEETVKRSAH
jgi:hypothetical protein